MTCINNLQWIWSMIDWLFDIDLVQYLIFNPQQLPVAFQIVDGFISASMTLDSQLLKSWTPLVSSKRYPNVRTTNYIVKIQKIDYFPFSHFKEKTHTLGNPWYTLHYFPMLLRGIECDPPLTMPITITMGSVFPMTNTTLTIPKEPINFHINSPFNWNLIRPTLAYWRPCSARVEPLEC